MTEFFFKNFLRPRRGFTMIELLVASVIIITLFSFVLARFRTAQSSGELDTAIKQIVDGITSSRTMSLGGQVMADGTVPTDGYGIKFDRTILPTRYQQVALTAGGPIVLPNGARQISGVTISQLCGSTKPAVTTAPCIATDWQVIGNTMEIDFPLTGAAQAQTGTGQTFQYVGGVITDDKTGLRQYFYVSLISGMVTSHPL